MRNLLNLDTHRFHFLPKVPGGMKSNLLVGIAILTGYFSIGQSVTGTIRDAETGEAIIGATVMEKDTENNGTTTDFDGTYMLTLETENPVLQVSYVGYQSLEVPYTGQTTLDIELSAGLVVDEVVVTALGVTRERKAIGYATTSLDSRDLSTTHVTNVASALYGKAPGVSIRTTPGGATSGVNINIRGFSSITGSTQPLIVMDGIPIRSGDFDNTNYWGDQRIRGNGLNDINPDDIASIDILKGASAAALYGSEAVNGVVLITTKSGRPGQKGFGVDFNASYNTDRIAYLPRYQNVRGPGYYTSHADLGQDEEGFIMVDTDGDGAGDTRGLVNTTLNFGPEFDGQPILSWDGVVRPYSAADNSYADLFQPSNGSSLNLALSHVAEKSSIRLSLTRQDNGMISIGSKNERNIGDLNTTFNVSDKLKTTLNIKYINQYTHNRPYKVDRMINNFSGMMDRFESADWYFDKYETSQGYRFVTGTNASLTPDENIVYNGFKGDIADYVWRVKNNNSDEYSNRVIASLTQSWSITNGLSLQGRVSTDYTSNRFENSSKTERPSTLYTNPGGGFSLNNEVSSLLYGDVLLTYQRDLTQEIGMSVMGGYTAQKDLYTSVSRGTNGGLSTENFFDLAASINTPNSGSSRRTEVKDAVLATLNLSYSTYLYLEGTIRRDRTSRISPLNNSFTYPSINGSFILNEALDLPNYVSFAKIRASYGIVGNYPGIYQANIAYNQNTLGIQYMGGQPILYTNISSSFGNDLIKPEKKKEMEFGLNVNLKTRFDLDVSYYDAKIVDQILPVTIPNTSGASSVLTNIGILRNKGVEVRLSADIIQQTNTYWSATINYAKNKNVVEKLANNATELLHADFDGNAAQIRSVVGRPMGDIYAHPIKVNESGQSIIDANGLEVLDGDRWEVYGNAMPDFEGGFVNNFAFKGITLDVIADFSVGSSIMPTGVYWLTSRGLTEESLNYMNAERGGLRYYVNSEGQGVQTTSESGPNGEPVFDNGVILEGVLQNGEPNTNVIPQSLYYAATYNWGGPQYGNSQYFRYINKNNWFKVREIALGYRLPASMAARVGAQRLNLSVYGRNLFFIYRSIKDIDPEQTTAGSRWLNNINNAGNNPSFRSFGVTLNAGF